MASQSAIRAWTSPWLWCAILALPGCHGTGKSVVIADQLDPAAVGQRAIELYDTDKNGAIDATELKQSPALASASGRIDQNKDGGLSAEEIANRIKQYQSQSDLIPLSLKLMKNQAPVSGAAVVFEPEAFMGENLPVFTGVSDASGDVPLAAEGVDLPGLPLGLYRVRISGPVEATQGCEVAEDTPNGTRMTLAL